MIYGKYIKQISDSLSRSADNNLNRIDVTFSQYGVLFQLQNCENYDATFKAIEKEQKISQPAVVGLVQRLEEKGLVVNYTDETDKRVKHSRLTDKGLEICKQATNDLIETESNLTNALTEKEKQQFFSLLKKVAEHLEK